MNQPKQTKALGIEAVGKEALSFLGVPLIAGDEVLGGISVQSFTTFDAFSERDRELLTAIAGQAAIALQNTMGSVCDLVQGIVEIPCHTRNAVAASSARRASRQRMEAQPSGEITE